MDQYLGSLPPELQGVQGTQPRMARLKPDTHRGTSRASHAWDTATEAGTCLDDFDDWKSSIDPSEMEHHTVAADDGPPAEQSATSCSGAGVWQHSGDLMSMKDGCASRPLCAPVDTT